MDPQQRILLEQTHTALVDSAACKGSPVEASTGLPSMCSFPCSSQVEASINGQSMLFHPHRHMQILLQLWDSKQ